MTISNLQDALVAELQELFSERKYKKPYSENEERVALTVYSQALPIVVRVEDEEPPEFSLAPYIVVELDEGDSGSAEKAEQVNMRLIICIYDDDENNQGHKDIMEIIERVKNRFMINPMLKNQYMYKEDEGIHWALPDENTHPYFFGGESISFEAPAVRKEDKFC